MPKKFDKKRIFYLIMTFLTAAEIFLFSTIKTTAGAPSGLNLATFYHFGVFFMFSFFLFLTIKDKKISNKIVLIILLISLIYAISDEFHQLFVPGRVAGIKDIIVDFAGSLCSVLLLKIVNFFNKL